ncbi:MAG: hypothetical protein ABI876_10550 [Bacteroidota bacterium]
MKIDSDGEDYYDRALLSRGTEGTFIRRGNGGLSRHDVFRYLHRLGWPTVPHGTTGELHQLLGDRFLVVVYRDLYQHGLDRDGEDPLVVVKPGFAAEQWPERLCSFYAPFHDDQQRVRSSTQLAIGSRRFLLEYHQSARFGESEDSWASNRGAYSVKVVRELPRAGFDPVMRYPLWSVDYLLTTHPTSLVPWPTAFDLNVAPMLAGTGMEEILGATTIADLVSEAMDYYQQTEGGDCDE